MKLLESLKNHPQLAGSAAGKRDRLLFACDAAGFAVPESGTFREEMETVLCFSDLVAESLTRRPELFQDLVSTGDLERSYGAGILAQSLKAQTTDCDSEEQVKAGLVRFRMREMIRIAWRDLTGKAGLEETTNDLSRLADACIDKAFMFLYNKLRFTYGTPVSRRGDEQPVIVLGMGKLGAFELNFSSDIDLIFAFPEPGETVGGTRSLSNDEFFTKLCRAFIRMFDSGIQEERLFRVDTRLRPFGDSGPLVMSSSALEDYYQTQGREWERYALIKARPVAGGREQGRALLKKLNPFIFRRYFDYGAFDSFREMKQRITLQVRDLRLKNNIKLGAGGIREIEFFGQLFQLIRGGVEPELQERSILKVLGILERRGFIDTRTRTGLCEAYVFLRNTEHRLQEFKDQQTHDIPEKTDDRVRLALSMGFDGWERFKAELDRHLATVHSHFRQLLVGREETRTETLDHFRYLWENLNDPQSESGIGQVAGFTDVQRVVQLLATLEGHPNTKKLTSDGRSRLNVLVPRLVQEAGKRNEPEEVLGRLIDLIIAVERRTCYISLLLENPKALNNLVLLAEKSPWIITHISRHPALLDELLSPATLFAPPDKAFLKQELDHRMQQLASDDFEFVLEDLCVFKQLNTLRIAAADISGDYPLMKVSDRLTFLAETILDRVIAIAWNLLVEKYGRPSGTGPDAEPAAGFAAIAYGKLGGIELGYKSDLDLVFVYDSQPGMTEGVGKSIENSRFYTLLGQRIISVLTVHTPAGTLYEADLRLRPSGQSGMIVSDIKGFSDYMENQAWTWEHQAIVRARAVCGDTGLWDSFDAIRKKVLMRKRDPEALKAEVREMRERIRRQHLSVDPGMFHIKHSRGGIVDIEFLVQYLVLRESYDHPELTVWTDNVRLIEALTVEGLLGPAEADDLLAAYLLLRKSLHRLHLQEKDAAVLETDFSQTITRVITVYDQYLGDV